MPVEAPEVSSSPFVPVIDFHSCPQLSGWWSVISICLFFQGEGLGRASEVEREEQRASAGPNAASDLVNKFWFYTVTIFRLLGRLGVCLFFLFFTVGLVGSAIWWPKWLEIFGVSTCFNSQMPWIKHEHALHTVLQPPFIISTVFLFKFISALFHI